MSWIVGIAEVIVKALSPKSLLPVLCTLALTTTIAAVALLCLPEDWRGGIPINASHLKLALVLAVSSMLAIGIIALSTWIWTYRARSGQARRQLAEAERLLENPTQIEWKILRLFELNQDVELETSDVTARLSRFGVIEPMHRSRSSLDVHVFRIALWAQRKVQERMKALELQQRSKKG